MLSGLSDKWHIHLQGRGRTFKICLAIAGAFLLFSFAIEVFLPKEYRACVLMPGMCKKHNNPKKSPFQQLDEGYHGGPKFGLTTGG